MGNEPLSELLRRHGVPCLYHVAPVAYLPWIARGAKLLSKRRLREGGFTDDHFRSTSRRADAARGFDGVVHLFSGTPAPLLMHKLSLGIPHIELKISLDVIPGNGVHLCRYNIAKHRVREFVENRRNGKLRRPFLVPVASSLREQADLLEFKPNTFEILIEDSVALPATTALCVFSEDDRKDVARILASADRAWSVHVEPGHRYPMVEVRRNATRAYVERAIGDASWRGDGLQIDR